MKTMSTGEARIRDYLVEHLELVEPGLQLVKKEFEVPNASGAKGYIDILARDRLGHLVVIELKRSDPAARTALHELHKYVALLRDNHGLSFHKIRCIVASTHWRELLVPFSEYSRSVCYSTEGRRIILDEHGVPVSLEPVELAPETMDLRICPKQWVLFYRDESEARRDKAAEDICEDFGRLGISDYLVLLMRNPKGHPRGVSPFAVYVAAGALSPDAKLALERKLKELQKLAASADEYGVDEVEEFDEEDAEGQEWYWEEAAVERATRRAERDEFEIGYPEKFMQMTSHYKWGIDKIIRGGRFESEQVIPDQAIITGLAGVQGENHVLYTTVCSPRFEPSWNAARAGAERCLQGNDDWWAGFYWFMDRAKQEAPASSVSATVFNPLNIVLALWSVYRNGDPTVFPRLEMVRDSGKNEPIHLLRGYLEWDGKTFPKDPEGIVVGVTYGGYKINTMWDFLFLIHMHALWELEPSFLKQHGLRYVLDEVQIQGGKVTSTKQFVVKKGRVVERKGKRGVPIVQFLAKNEGYLAKLAELIEANVSTVPT